MTAKEFLISKRLNGWVNYTIVSELMSEFAKYHVELALTQAHKKMQLPEEDLEFTLNSYDLNNIK